MTLILHFGRKINGLVSFLGQSKYSRVLRLSLLPAKYKDSRILRDSKKQEYEVGMLVDIVFVRIIFEILKVIFTSL